MKLKIYKVYIPHLVIRLIMKYAIILLVLAILVTGCTSTQTVGGQLELKQIADKLANDLGGQNNLDEYARPPLSQYGYPNYTDNAYNGGFDINLDGKTYKANIMIVSCKPDAGNCLDKWKEYNAKYAEIFLNDYKRFYPESTLETKQVSIGTNNADLTIIKGKTRSNVCPDGIGPCTQNKYWALWSYQGKVVSMQLETIEVDIENSLTNTLQKVTVIG
jgi:hypothetical protein